MKRPDYNEYLQSEAWHIRRRWKLEQADFRCQVCNASGNLQVHHRTYERLGNERENDLTVLCETCHGRFHNRLSKPAVSAAKSSPATSRLGPERNLILLMLHDEEWIGRTDARLDRDDFRDPVYREIYTELLRWHDGSVPDGPCVDWLEKFGSEGVGACAREILGDPEGRYIENLDRFFEENIRDIEARAQRERVTEIDQELRSAGGDRVAELLREKVGIRHAMERAGVVLRILRP